MKNNSFLFNKLKGIILSAENYKESTLIIIMMVKPSLTYCYA